MTSALVTDLLGVLDQLAGGVHAGFRPAHAKGLMCEGTFNPSREAAAAFEEFSRMSQCCKPRCCAFRAKIPGPSNAMRT